MKTTTSTLLSIRIRQLRKENGLLQSELAARLGVTTSNISNYENGRNSPPIEKIQELSEIFRVPIDYLTGESNNRSYKDDKKFIEIDNYIGDLLRELSKSENTFKYNGFPVTLEAKEVLRHNLEHTLQILQIQQSKFFNNPTED